MIGSGVVRSAGVPSGVTVARVLAVVLAGVLASGAPALAQSQAINGND